MKIAPLSGGKFTFSQLKGWCQQFRIITYCKKYLNFILHGSFFASLNENVSVIIGVHLKAGVCVCVCVCVCVGGGYEKTELQTCSKNSSKKKGKKTSTVDTLLTCNRYR